MPRQPKTMWTFAVFLAVLLAYANSFQNGFHFDDFHTVTDNPAVRSLSNVPRFFTDATTFSVLPANRTYRPTVSTSLALDYFFGHGYTPFWFHLGTVLEFLLLVWLVSELAGTMYRRTDDSPFTPAVALVAAAWFGLHPAMAETINYVIQRGDLFCTLGCVAALLIYAQFPAWRKSGLYLLPLFFALLSKPPAAIFPLLLFAWVWFFEPEATRTTRWKHAAFQALPALGVTVIGMVLQSAMTPKSFAPSTLNAADYRLTQPYVWLRYFGALFLPVHLNADSDLRAFANLNAQAIAGLLFVAALAAAIWYCGRRQRLYPLAFGLVWFVLTQVPTSIYALSEVENDHRMFFSFAGLMPGVVWAMWLGIRSVVGGDAGVRKARTALLAGTLVLLCGYSYGTRLRNTVWRTDESLWWDDVQKSPQNGRGLMNYGLSQMALGRYERALDYFTRAAVFTPNYPSLEINLGIVNGQLARAGEAESHFTRAIALAPQDDQTHAFYSRWLLRQGRAMEANLQVRMAHDLNPARNPDAFVVAPAGSAEAAAVNASMAAYQRGDYTAAIAAAQQALTANAHSTTAYNNIGASYARLGMWQMAADAERKAIAIDPSFQLARNNLADAEQHLKNPDAASASQPVLTATDWINRSVALYQGGQFEASIAAAHKAIEADPASYTAWNNIAAANASMHRWDEAIAAARKALELKPDFQLASNNLAWAEGEKGKAR